MDPLSPPRGSAVPGTDVPAPDHQRRPRARVSGVRARPAGRSTGRPTRRR
ncbi:hypothetical protein [Ornithinimicrobium kibberense]